jgi:hypothetical protein
MHILVGEAPEHPQQGDEQQRLLGVAPRAPARSRRQGRWAAPVGVARGAATQRQQVQLADEREGVDMQGGTQTCLGTVICWGRD